MSRWESEPEALKLLEREGGPFGSAAFRRCWLASNPEDVDVSWAGRLDGNTRAAIALIKLGPVAESVPLNYGGIIATRPLRPREVRTFLITARRAAGCRWIASRSVPLGDPDAVCHFGSPIAGWASVVRLGKGVDVESTFAHKARRAIRGAEAAGARPTVTRDPDAFLRLYQQESKTHIYRYSDGLIRDLARQHLAWFHEIELDGASVASVMVLRAPSHWMAWLAAQNESGRAVHANYLAVADLLRIAAAAGATAVNLGISTGMPGVALFKRRLGAVAVPVTMDRIGTPVGVLVDWWNRRARNVRRRWKGLVRRSSAYSRRPNTD